MEQEERVRQVAVRRHLAGESVGAICRSLGRARAWFYKWWERQQTGQEDWWTDRSRRPHGHGRAIGPPLEGLVLEVRDRLESQGLFCGAQAILWELEDLEVPSSPSERTIARILSRHHRVRRQLGRYVPKGKRYPAVPSEHAGDVHQTDFVGPRYLGGGARFYSLHSIDVVTNRCAIEPLERRTQMPLALWWSWLRLGLPQYQQVDNEWVFCGSPAHPRGMGKLIRLCLLVGVEPLFIPVREPWRNGVVEKFNHHWQQGFFGRVNLADTGALRPESLKFECRHNTRYRYSKLGGRTPQQSLEQQKVELRYPGQERPPEKLLKPEEGRYHLIRFIRGDGKLDVFGEPFLVPPEAIYEYVWVTVDVAAQRLTLQLDRHVIEEWPYRLR
jgi:putative transposase